MKSLLPWFLCLFWLACPSPETESLAAWLEHPTQVSMQGWAGEPLADGGVGATRWNFGVRFQDGCPRMDGGATLNGVPLEQVRIGGETLSGGVPPGVHCDGPLWRIPNDVPDIAVDEFRLSDGTTDLTLRLPRFGAERYALLPPPQTSELIWNQPAQIAWSVPEDGAAITVIRLDVDGGRHILANVDERPVWHANGIVTVNLPDGGAPNVGELHIFATPRPVPLCSPSTVTCTVAFPDFHTILPVTVRDP